MPRPGVTVTTSAAAATPVTSGQRLGRWMVAAQTQRGPVTPDPANPVQSLSDYTALYGERSTTVGTAATTYDAVETFFRCGGAEMLIARVVGTAATSAELELDDSEDEATLTVTAIGPGDWYDDHVKISVVNSTTSYVINVLVDDVVTETSPALVTTGEAVTWALSSKYIRITDEGEGTLPVTLSATVVAGGADDLSGTADPDTALALMPASWGPGLVSKIGVTSSAEHITTVTYAAATNRLAILDGAQAASAATLSSLAGTVAAGVTYPEYGMLCAPYLTLPAVAGTGSATRSIAPSAAAAGLISAQVSAGLANVAAAGPNGAVPVALGVAQTFTTAELDTLNGSRAVCPFRQPYSATVNPPVALYGYNTLGLSSGGWRQATAQLLRLRLTDELQLVGEQFMFTQIDSRGQTIAEFNAALCGVLQGHFDDGELYADDPDDPSTAYIVDTDTVNTASTIAAGELHARVGVKIAPHAEFVYIDVVKSAVDQTLA